MMTVLETFLFKSFLFESIKNHRLYKVAQVYPKTPVFFKLSFLMKRNLSKHYLALFVRTKIAIFSQSFPNAPIALDNRSFSSGVNLFEIFSFRKFARSLIAYKQWFTPFSFMKLSIKPQSFSCCIAACFSIKSYSLLHTNLLYPESFIIYPFSKMVLPEFLALSIGRIY